MTDVQDLISVNQLSFARGTCDVLQAIDWQIKSGDFAVIVGENGAGKTTLLQCLCQILQPRAGSIHLLGKALATYAPRELAKILSYLPQADHRVVPYRVHEFVAMGRYPHLNPWAGLTAADHDAVDAAMTRVGVQPLANRLLTTLSGGERRKVSLAAALAQGADVLLLDEPATFLDPRHQVEARRTLRQLNADGITIVMVTHDLNSVAALANNVLALRHGRTVYAGPAADYLNPKPLRDTFGIDFEITATNGTTRIYPQDSGDPMEGQPSS